MDANYELPFKRRYEKKTNYKKRLAALRSKKPRLVVRKSLKHTRAQIIDFASKGDKVLVSASSEELQNMGWKNSTSNIPASYLVGLILGKRALDSKVKGVVFDIGLYPNVKGSRINSVLKGASDAGLEIPRSENVLPSDDRIRGRHVAEYAKKFGGKKHLFSKNKPDKIEDDFLKLKSMILKGDINGKERKARGKGRKGS